MSTPRYKQVAAIVRAQIEEGALTPGESAPSGAALSRMTGYSILTCRRALRILIADGVLVQGASQSARPRVPGHDRNDRTLAEAKNALSATLAAHRRAASLTQPQFAKIIGLSVTTIGHAETGRLWQSRPFWERADKALNANGELLRLHDAYRAAEVPAERTAADKELTAEEPTAEELSGEDTIDVSETLTITVSGPLTSVTITWPNGEATTVYPPDPDTLTPEITA